MSTGAKMVDTYDNMRLESPPTCRSTEQMLGYLVRVYKVYHRDANEELAAVLQNFFSTVHPVLPNTVEDIERMWSEYSASMTVVNN